MKYKKGQKVFGYGMGYGAILEDEGEVCCVQFEAYPAGQAHTVDSKFLQAVEPVTLDGFNSNPPGGTICPKCYARCYGNDHKCPAIIPDSVKAPSHYCDGRQYEPRKVIRDWGLSWEIGSAVKYLARAGRKDKDKQVEDLRKAIEFIQFEIEGLEAKK